MAFGIKSKIILLKNLIASPFTIISFWKIKVRSYSYKTTDFHIIEIPEADSNDICQLLVLIGSLFKKDENYYEQVSFKKCEYMEKEER